MRPILASNVFSFLKNIHINSSKIRCILKYYMNLNNNKKTISYYKTFFVEHGHPLKYVSPNIACMQNI